MPHASGALRAAAAFIVHCMTLMAVTALIPNPAVSVVAAASDPVKIFGVTLVGVSRSTGVKLLFTLALIALVLIVRSLVLLVLRRVLGGDVADPEDSGCAKDCSY